MSEIEQAGTLAIPGAVTPTSLKLPADLALGEWLRCGKMLARISAGVQWWIGDWLVYGEERSWGEKYSQALDETSFDYGTLRNMASVSRKVGLSLRNDRLSWNHHRMVADLEPEAQKRWLARAVAGDDGKQWSYRRLRLEIKSRALAEAPWPKGTYRVIYADPPWEYGDERLGLDAYGPARLQYPTMPTEAIAELPVASLAALDSVLFLWSTSAMLPDALQVIEAWGFAYKTSFVWDKVAHNYGPYHSVRHELLLIATRGSCTPDADKKHDSVVSLERTPVHSQKPGYFRELIDSLYTWGPRIELFLRGEPAAGWEGWGNEAEDA